VRLAREAVPELDSVVVMTMRWLIGIALCSAVCPQWLMPPMSFSSHPITILVPFAAGGSSDVVMRWSRNASPKVSTSRSSSKISPGGAGNIAALVIKNAGPTATS